MAITLDGTTGITTPPIILTSAALGNTIAGEFEYDGKVPYFTPQGTQRGVLPGMQYYRLNSAVVGTNATGAQSAFGVGVTLSSSTVYQFRAVINLIKTAGTTSHTVSTLFGGTATFNNIVYNVSGADGNGTWGAGGSGAANRGVAINAATAVTVSGALTAATQVVWLVLDGTMSINVGGTLIPQYSLSAAPGGAYSTQIGSYFSIYPIGASGSNINVGTWA
jgi:hypothetical protein